jgi:dihydrofolate reductase
VPRAVQPRQVALALVAALDENFVIGACGDLPWQLPDDQKHFMTLTLGHCVAMGRLTFESLPKPLPGRTNLVLSQKAGYAPAGAVVVPTLDAAIEETARRGESLLFVAGGAGVYAEALPRAAVLHLTRVHARVAGDVYFPNVDFSQFERAAASEHAADARHAYAFTVEEWRRRSPGAA